jgi:hypothetical protein
MPSFTKMGWRGFSIGTLVLFAIASWLNYWIFGEELTNALAITLGSLMGAYVFTLIIWRLVRIKMKEAAMDAPYFILLGGSILMVGTILSKLIY